MEIPLFNPDVQLVLLFKSAILAHIHPIFFLGNVNSKLLSLRKNDKYFKSFFEEILFFVSADTQSGKRQRQLESARASPIADVSQRERFPRF